MPLGCAVSAVVVLGLLSQNPTPAPTPRPESASPSSPMLPTAPSGTQLHIDFRPRVDRHKTPTDDDCPPVSQPALVGGHRPIIGGAAPAAGSPAIRPLIPFLRFPR